MKFTAPRKGGLFQDPWKTHVIEIMTNSAELCTVLLGANLYTVILHSRNTNRIDKQGMLYPYWYILNNFISSFLLNWRCSDCKRKRSLRTTSFFEEFPRVPLATLLFVIYYFCSGLVFKIYQRLHGCVFQRSGPEAVRTIWRTTH